MLPESISIDDLTQESDTIADLVKYGYFDSMIEQINLYLYKRNLYRMPRNVLYAEEADEIRNYFIGLIAEEPLVIVPQAIKTILNT